MNEFTLLIKDNVLDKEQLVLKRSSFLNIDPVQSQYIAKLFANKELNFNKLSLKEISDTASIPVNAAEALTKDLIKTGLVGIKKEEENFFFDYNVLISKIIESYIAPTNDSTEEEKYNWTVKTINFELTDSNKSDLRLIIKENGWDNLKIAITKIMAIDGQTWHQLMSMYEALGVKETTDSQELKAILDQNWLEN